MQSAKKNHAIESDRLHEVQEFDEWWETHKESEECEINFTGSSGAMESATAVFFSAFSGEIET